MKEAASPRKSEAVFFRKRKKYSHSRRVALPKKEQQQQKLKSLSERFSKSRIPKIIEAYGPDNIRFNENSITVTIPYDRLGENVPVAIQNAPVDVPVRIRNKTGIENSILFLAYEDKRTIRKYIKPLLETGRLAMTVPDKPNSSKQKYITIR